MKISKRITAIILTVIFGFGILSFTGIPMGIGIVEVQAEVLPDDEFFEEEEPIRYPNILDSGNCGEQAKWSLDKNGVMTISGTGEMYDYQSIESWKVFEYSPWEEYKKKIVKVVVKNGIESIGKHAFYEYPNLKNIVIPSSVKRIGSCAFSRCKKLEQISITKKTTDIAGAFDNTKWWKKQTKGIVYIGKVAYGYKGKCPSKIKIKKGTVAISNRLLSGHRELTQISIPKSVKTIGDSAFSGCRLKTLKIPEGVTEIGKYAFSSNYELATVSLPKSLKSVGNGAFDSCNIQNLTIRNKKMHIGISVFKATPITRWKTGAVYFGGILCDYYRTGKAEPLKVKKGTSSIADYVFSSSNITSVSIPKSVKMIGANPFTGCSKLGTIKVAKGNKAYDSRDNCNAIIKKKNGHLISGCKNTVIPKKVTCIEVEAFSGCTGLKKIEIPGSVKIIDDLAFSGCSGLKRVAISNGVKTIGIFAFRNCPKLKKVTIPGSVTNIGAKAIGFLQNPITGKFNKVKGFTIYAEKGSAGETYAKENGFKFVAT